MLLKIKNRKAISTQELRSAKRASWRIYCLLLRVLREDFFEKRPQMKVRFNLADRMRLNIFQVWSERHKISLRLTLKLMVEYWRKKTRLEESANRRKRSPLGVTISAFCSARSEPILAGIVATDFPEHENEDDWRNARRRELLAIPTGLQVSLLDTVKYSKKILERRKKLDRAQAAEERKRRRWRGNPWL